MTYRRSALNKTFLSGLVVLAMTALVLVLAAILLPPKDSNAMPRDGGAEAPAVSSR